MGEPLELSLHDPQLVLQQLPAADDVPGTGVQNLGVDGVLLSFSLLLSVRVIHLSIPILPCLSILIFVLVVILSIVLTFSLDVI